MSKNDFQHMEIKQLKDYILSHRDDDQAFYTFVDRIEKEKKWTNYPPMESTEDMKKYPEVLDKLKQDSGRKIPDN